MIEVSPDFTAKVFAGCGLDRYTTASSALGEMFVAWSDCGVSAVRIVSDEQGFEAWYRERFERGCVPAVEIDPIATAARARLQGEDGEVPVDVGAIETVTRRGFRYVGCERGWFCLPTCGTVARRIDDPGYMGLRNAEEAHEHGLVPCHLCRPIAA